MGVTIYSKERECSFLLNIALFIGYLRCYSPVTNKYLWQHNEGFYNQYVLPELAHEKREELGEETFMTIMSGKLKVQIGNEQHYKAWQAKMLVGVSESFYNLDWVMLRNNSRTKFVTCDVPIIPLLDTMNIASGLS